MKTRASNGHGHSSRRRFSAAFTAAVVVGAASAAVVACGGPKTSMTQVWSAEVGTNAHPMHKIVVMGARMDEANRRVLEDTFVNALAGRGVEAIPSYKLFPQGGTPDRAHVEEAVKSIEADGVLVATFKGIRERLTYVPGTASGSYYAYGYYGGSFYGGYVATDDIVNLETTLWDARAADTVVWSALTNTLNPSSGQSFVKSVSETVVPALSQAGFIPPGPQPKK